MKKPCTITCLALVFCLSSGYSPNKEVEAIFILRDGREISAEYITMLYKAPDSYVGTPKMLLGREIYYCIKENGVEIQRTFDFSEIESMEISAFGPKTYCL